MEMKSEVEQNTTTKKPTTQGCECSEAKRLRHIQSWQPAAPRTVLGSSSFRQVVTHTGTKSASPHFKRGALVFIKAQPHTRTQTHSHTHTHVYILSPSLRVCLTLSYTAHTRAQTRTGHSTARRIRTADNHHSRETHVVSAPEPRLAKQHRSPISLPRLMSPLKRPELNVPLTFPT